MRTLHRIGGGGARSVARKKKKNRGAEELGQAIGRGHKGLRHSEATRRQISEAHRRRGTGGPNPRQTVDA
jgi:hypothetical protein